MSEKPIPKAENTAAIFGINTLCTPVVAAPQALIGPAPPNAAMVVSPGSSIADANDSGDPLEIRGFHPDQSLFDANAERIREPRGSRSSTARRRVRPAVEVGVRVEEPSSRLTSVIVASVPPNQKHAAQGGPDAFRPTVILPSLTAMIELRRLRSIARRSSGWRSVLLDRPAPVGEDLFLRTDPTSVVVPPTSIINTWPRPYACARSAGAFEPTAGSGRIGLQGNRFRHAGGRAVVAVDQQRILDRWLRRRSSTLAGIAPSSDAGRSRARSTRSDATARGPW